VETTGGGIGSVDIGHAIASDSVGNIYVTGEYNGTSTFGTITLPFSGSRSIFLVQYNAITGVAQWAQTGTGTVNMSGQGVAVDSLNNVYMTGFFTATTTFDTITVTAVGTTDMFVAKYNNSGTIQWVRTAGAASSSNSGYGVAVDPADNIYVSGAFQNMTTFDTITVTAVGSFDVFMAQYNTSGTVQSVQTGGGVGAFDFGNAIAADPINSVTSVYVTGSYSANSIFVSTPIVTPTGTPAMFLVKYSFTTPCVAEGTLVELANGYNLAIEKLRPGHLLRDHNGRTVRLNACIRIDQPVSTLIELESGSLARSSPCVPLRIRQGHPLLIKGKEVLPEELLGVPGVKEVRLPRPVHVYTLLTERRTFVQMQGVSVGTWSEMAWQNFADNDSRSTGMRWTAM